MTGTNGGVVVQHTTPRDRSSLWLPLLRRLTAASPYWVVWKNVESALVGTGDIDAAAPESDWPIIEREFTLWAQGFGLGPVIVCRHIPGGLNLIAMPRAMSALLELGVKARKIWRGATLFVLDDLKPLMITDPRGFRRIRHGAEGLFKLLLNGTRWNGQPNLAGLEGKHVVELLRADPEGVQMAARLFGPARKPVLRAAVCAAAGDWDRNSMIMVEGLAVLRSLRNPGVMASRLHFRFRAQRTCPVVAALLRDQRRIPSDRTEWLRRVALNHRVVDNAL